MISIRAPKVPFNFHFKIGMKENFFVYTNFISKLKIEKRHFNPCTKSIILFSDLIEIENCQFLVFPFSILN